MYFTSKRIFDEKIFVFISRFKFFFQQMQFVFESFIIIAFISIDHIPHPHLDSHSYFPFCFHNRYQFLLYFDC